MIDWISGVFPLDHYQDVKGGGMIRYKITPEGLEVPEWEKTLPLPVEGSFSSSVYIVSDYEGMVYVTGNPSKFLQGHNVFGTDDLRGLIPAFLMQICNRIGLSPTDSNLADWIAGNYQLTRVDVAQMYSLPNRAAVRSWLRAAELQSTSRHGRPVSRGGTVYWGKHSRRWSFKGYSKGDELDVPKHMLPSTIPNRDDLAKLADNKLRLELTLRSMQLKDTGLSHGYNWAVGVPLDLHQKYLESINMSEQLTLSGEVLEGLPGRLQMAYQSWRRGDDLRAMLPKQTYYRYRSELLKYGIDINVQQTRDDSNVVPLVHVLKPEAVLDVPEWAKGTSLYFEPSKVA